MAREGRLTDSRDLGESAECMRDDADFRVLVRTNTHAALAMVGIRVPGGVRVTYAPDISCALSIAIDQAPQTEVGGATLDECTLHHVVGGIARVGCAGEIKRFLETLQSKPV